MANNPMLDVTMLLAAQQAYNVSDTGVFSGTLPTGYVVDDSLIPGDRVDPNGLKLIAFKNDATGERIIAFSGTEFSSKDLYTDAQLGANQWQSAESIIRNYISQVMADVPAATFHFTGHSLGGGLAEYAAYFAKTDRALSPLDPTITLTTFNAMGTLDSLARRTSSDPAGITAAKAAINTAMTDMYIAHYVAKGDLVGLLGGGHVGEIVNGQLNTYTAGTNTRFFLTAHDKFNSDFQSLAYAQLHDYRSEYLSLQTTQGVLAQIASLGNGSGHVSSPAAALRLGLGVLSAIQAGNQQQLDQLGDWIATNLYQSGLIDANTYTAAVQVDWGIAGNIGNILSISGAAVVVGVTGQVADVLDTLSQWAGGTADALINSVRADTKRYTDTVTTKLGNAAGRGAATDLSTWQDNGYDFTVVSTQAQNTATQAINNPSTLQAQVDANPLSFLPTLTAPVRSDYSSDPVGDTAYQTALTLYNHKQNERTQVQTLYNQYVTETNNLTPLAFHTPRDPADWQTVIQGDQDPNSPHDTLAADPVTTQIRGLAGDDVLDAKNVTGIQLYGGLGHDGLRGDYFYSSEYYFRGATEFETAYGRVKPGQGIFAYGEAGNDRMLGSLRDDTLDGGWDPDYLDGYVGDDTVFGGPGHDLMNGEEGQDDLQGNDDNDLIAGGEGADHLLGGTGSDQLYGDSQYRYATWNGTAGTLIYGTLTTESLPVVKDAPETQSGDDVIEGGDGSDQIFGGEGSDLISGDAGNDTNLQGEGGDDILFGGDGDDMLWGDSSANAVTNDAQIIPGDSGTYTYYWRERHVGLDGNDYLDGGLGADNLWGGGGNDHLVGGLGMDYLQGGLGNGSVSGDDTLEGGADNDYLFGEDGSDTLRGDAGIDELHAGDGNDGLFGGTENDKLWGDGGIDVLHGEAGDDYLDGGDGEDTLFGGDGKDTLIGGPGRDVIYAGLADDTIVGNDNDDLIFGEDGNDTIDGGAGNDELYAGAGLNTLIGGLGNDTLFGGPGNDIIKGGEGDDTVDGGGGTDTVYLSAGNDNYLNIQSDGDYRIALDPNISDNFIIVLQDAGGTDALRFDPVPIVSGPYTYYYAPALESLTRQGDDLVIGVWLHTSLVGVPDRHGTVRLTNQYIPQNRIESITGLKFVSSTPAVPEVLVTEETASQITGLYLDRFGNLGGRYRPNTGGIHYGSVGQALLVGTPNDDLLQQNRSTISQDSAHVFYGHEGHDTLIGTIRNDQLHGGPGADRMEGKAGDDVYYTDLFDGDSLWDNRGATYGTNIEFLILPDGIALNRLAFLRQGNDLWIDNTRIQDYFVGWSPDVVAMPWQHEYGIEYMRGQVNATPWSVSLPAHLLSFSGLSAEVIDVAGNDSRGLFGDNFANAIYGGDGRGDIQGFGGNDILAGGSSSPLSGSNNLYGGAGDDAYLINAADLDASWGTLFDESPGGTDTLSLGGGLVPSSLYAWLERVDYGDGTYDDMLVLKFPNHNNSRFDVPWFTRTWNEAGTAQIDLDYRLERVQFLGNGNDKIYNFSGLVSARLTELRAAYDANPANPAPMALFRPADLTAFDITAGTGFAGGEYARNYATTGTFARLTINTVNGTAADDVLTGLPGTDYLNGGVGNDVLSAGGGGDRLDGGSGADTMFGGAGNDTYVVDNAADVVSELTNAGTDTVESAIRYTLPDQVENLTLTGAGAINGIGNAANNTLDGSLNSAANVLTGGAGDDTYVVGAGDIIVENANEGTDTVKSSMTYTLGATLENLTLTGTSVASGTGNALNNVLDGSQNTAVNVLAGGVGNDIYIIDISDMVVENPNEGTDTVQSSVTHTLSTDVENLTLTGAGAINGIGNAGNNILDAAQNTAVNVLAGGLGDDTYILGAGDTVTELLNQGTDTVSSSIAYTLGPNVENLTLTGTAVIDGTGNELNNVLTGNNAPNTLAGLAGNDTLTLGSGGRLFGGDGADVLDSTAIGVWSYAYGEAGNDTLRGAGYLGGGDGDDVLIVQGGYPYSSLEGGLGNDSLIGGSGFSYFYGNEGSDTLTAGGGGGYLYGGPDSDVLDTAGSGSWAYAMGGGGNDTLRGFGYLGGGAGDDVLTALVGYSSLEGGDGNDTLSNGLWYGYMNGDAGNDTLNAGAGGATLRGGADDDRLNGGASDDTLYGGIGADILTGGASGDRLNGGPGNDTYFFNTADGQDSLTDYDTAPNVDTVNTGVNPLNLVFRQSGSTLQMNLHGTTDRLTVASWYAGTANQTEVFQAGDNSTLANTQVDQLIQAMAQFSASHGGITWDQAIDQNPGEVQAVIAAYWQPAV